MTFSAIFRSLISTNQAYLLSVTRQIMIGSSLNFDHHGAFTKPPCEIYKYFRIHNINLYSAENFSLFACVSKILHERQLYCNSPQPTFQHICLQCYLKGKRMTLEVRYNEDEKNYSDG